jgi:hypothetical protein
VEDVEKDLRKTNVKRWRQKAVDREERASVIKEAKAVRGPYSQTVINWVNSCCKNHEILSDRTPLMAVIT